MIFDKYPYTNFHEMNDDWIIQTMKMMDAKLDEFVTMNSLTYADPILYDPETNYPANTVVIDDNTAYVSKRTVPAGILPTNGDYWLMIFPFGDLIETGITESEAILTAHINEYLANAVGQLMPGMVDNYLAVHPELTTTVQPLSIGYKQISRTLRNTMLAEYTQESETIITDFQQGALNVNSGAEVVSNTACRTGYMSFGNSVIAIVPRTEYRISVFKYTTAGVFIDDILYDVDAYGDAFVSDPDHKFRFVIKKADNTDFTPSDLPDRALWYHKYVPNVSPAMIENINENIAGLKAGDTPINVTWEAGNIFSNGNNSSNVMTFLRSVSYVDGIIGKDILITLAPGTPTSRMLNVYKYSEDGVFISYVIYRAANMPTTITFAAGYKYRFLWKDNISSNQVYADEISIVWRYQIDYVPETVKTAILSKAYDLGMAAALVRAEKRNPFAFSAFGQPYISFCWDGPYPDIDKVAALFKAHNFPVCVGATPSFMYATANGLTADSNGYTVGMSIPAVLEKIVENDGEILLHPDTLVTAANQNNYDAMYKCFIADKSVIENYGFIIRGHVRHGGTGVISGTKEIEKWLIGNFEYSNQGTAVNYSIDRVTIANTLENLKAAVDNAVQNNSWLRFMCHTLDTSNPNGVDYQTLSDLLDYIDGLNIDVVTYAYMFDNFSSSAFIESQITP